MKMCNYSCILPAQDRLKLCETGTLTQTRMCMHCDIFLETTCAECMRTTAANRNDAANNRDMSVSEHRDHPTHRRQETRVLLTGSLVEDAHNDTGNECTHF